MRATSSNIKIQNCKFNDTLSFYDGGAFNFKDNYSVEGSNLNFNNVTSLGLVLINKFNFITQFTFKMNMI